MQFEAAWCWLLIVPLVAFAIWLSRRSYAHLDPWARWTSLGLRILIITLLIAALSRPSLSRSARRGHLIVLLDVSSSVTTDNLEAAMATADRLIRDASAASHPPRTSVVAFGRSAALMHSSTGPWDGWPESLKERLQHRTELSKLYAERTRLVSAHGTNGDPELVAVEDRIADVERFRDAVAGDRTDVEQAVRLALNCGPIDEGRTVYVFTDANFNRGDWTRAWNDAAARNDRLHTVVLDRPVPPEVAVTALQTPATVRIDQGFSADVRVASTVHTTAELTVYKDRVLVHQQQVELSPGDNTIRVPGLHFGQKGFHAVEVALRPREDTEVSNNRIRSLVVVPGQARVLYIEGDINQVHYLKGALELEGMQVDARTAAGVPSNLSELLSFDTVILCNVPADRLSMRQMQMIRSYVQDFGGGFLMLGGDDSFGLGGYYNTPVEEILPVRMPIQKEMNRPSLALMLVIDKSGSMAGVKIQLAKRAAVATAEAINPRDLIGVVGFDGESRVLLELTAAADRATIASHVAALEAGGGTYLYPALEDAHWRLSQANARKKHVIVLSDGQTQGFGYEDLASLMSADGITVTTIGIGEGADMNLLEAVATAGGGRVYFTNDFHAIPQIFTREALRASKSMLVERLVQPVAVGDDAALREIDTDDLPLLTGYVATTAKPGANLILQSDSGDPLLAKWRYGLGRTVAFTSEAKPRWAEDWLDWEYFAKFWSQLVRSVTGEALSDDVYVECAHRVTDDVVILSADVRNATGGFVSDVDLQLSSVDAGGRAVAIPVVQAAPGLFEGIAGPVRYGDDQQFLWRASPAGHEEKAVSYGFVASFSPEYATLGFSAPTADQLRNHSAGAVMSLDAAKLELNNVSVARWIALAPALLIAAIALIPFDILVRRLG